MIPKYTIKQARETWKRCRKAKHFICVDPDPSIICPHCKKSVTEFPDDCSPGYRGNRAWINPKNGKFAVYHYVCSWESLLDDIFKD